MILKQLREETSEQHQALEKQLPLTDGQLTRDVYVQIVERFYGYYLPLETRLSARGLLRDIDFDFAERWKAPRLEKDLRVMGSTLETLKLLPQCGILPSLDTIPRTLGCLYVMEGATLGGRIITGHLAFSLGITPQTGGAFFAGYESKTGMRWQTFGLMIRAAAEKFGSADEIVASANRTFATMGAWLFPNSS